MKPSPFPGSVPALITVFSMLLCLAGCAAGKPSFDQVVPDVPELSGDQGRFVFFVPKRARHAGWRPMITLNGEEVGRAKTNGFFYVDRPAGDYEVAHLITTTVQGKRNTVEERSKKTFSLKPGETLFVQMVLTPGVGFEPRMERYDPMFMRPVLADPEQALEAVKACHYTGKDPKSDSEAPQK